MWLFYSPKQYYCKGEIKKVINPVKLVKMGEWGIAEGTYLSIGNKMFARTYLLSVPGNCADVPFPLPHL